MNDNNWVLVEIQVQGDVWKTEINIYGMVRRMIFILLFINRFKVFLKFFILIFKISGFKI